MATAAARVGPKLLKLIAKLDDGSRPIAETCRLVGAEADRLGVTRPSYERVRQLVHEKRRRRAGSNLDTARLLRAASLLADVATGVRSPQALLDYASGIGLPPYDGRAGLK